MANIYKIKEYCISNGEGLRTAVFFSGCTHKCKNCFNPELWDFNVGTPMNIESILSTINPHVAGLSLLGGDPLDLDNYNASLELCKKFKEKFPNKTIWVWTGNLIENIDPTILNYIDVLIDGPFIQELYDYDLLYRGSSNQRILYKGKDF